MNDFLALTLRGERPSTTAGETAALHWRWRDEGVLELTPRAGYRRAVVLSAGVHGNETAPIELLNALVGDLLAGRLNLGVRLLAVLGNPAAIRVGKRYLHSDMNRMFGGRHAQFAPGEDTTRARRLEPLLAAFFEADAPERDIERHHYDLHTAIRESLLPRFGVLPYQPRPYSPALLAALAGAELDALVVHSEPGGTFSHFSSEHFQAESCTLELGKARPFGQNDLGQFSAIDCVLRALVSAGDIPPRTGAPLRVFGVDSSLIKRSDDFQLFLADDTPNFTRIDHGTLLCEQAGESYRVQPRHAWILFPNPNVALGLRAGLVLTKREWDSLSAPS
ncbi:succinylglutamate desuccinylase [Lonsdalea quercina]|uniref:succinylglutamate desuccinylase n=1 Tax=Lonsdalea quercina TaxID=71657 RepID=UPI00397552A9